MTQESADIVIVGGGILGCSIAYHLSKLGAPNVVLFEQSALTHGATWHAAGVVGQMRMSRNLSYMLQRSVQLYRSLEEDTGQATGWRQTGSLKLVSSRERLREIERAVSFAKAIDIKAEVISPTEVKDLFPALEVGDILGALYVPEDGVADPSMLTNALATGARKRGVLIHQDTRVTQVIREGRRVKAVVTDKGTFDCRILVNAAGLWARELGRMFGVNLPCCAIQSQYIITDPSPDIAANMPSLRDADWSVYFKPEANGLIVGCFEPNSQPFDATGIRPNFAQELLPPDLDRMAPFLELAAKRMPLLDKIGVRHVVNGPIPFSPDGEMVLGRVPTLENVFVAAGCPIGIAAGGGVGELMAEWILSDQSPYDVADIDVRRFEHVETTRSFMYPSAIEAYGNHYAMQLSPPTLSASRCYRTSPLHCLFESRNAVFDRVSGWERPAWFRGPDGPAAEKFEMVRREHSAVCDAAGLFDLTSLAKAEVHGPGAVDVLEHLAVGRMDVPVGQAVPTLFCNKDGGIEVKLTVMRIADDRFYLVTEAEHGLRMREWIRANMPRDAEASVDDVTSHFGTLLVAGPKARQIVRALLDTEWDSERRDPDQGIVEIVAGIPVRMYPDDTTLSPGWQIHAPMDGLYHLYGRIHEIGAGAGLLDCGYAALKTQRIEAGSVTWGLEINMETTPFEARLGALVDLDKGDFIGRAALLAQRESGPSRVLTLLTIDEDIQLIGNELVRKNGELIGTTTGPCYSHKAEKWIAHAYLTQQDSSEQALSIEAYGRVVAAACGRPRALRSVAAA